jgi:hypothetical protein
MGGGREITQTHTRTQPLHTTAPTPSLHGNAGVGSSVCEARVVRLLGLSGTPCSACVGHCVRATDGTVCVERVLLRGAAEGGRAQHTCTPSYLGAGVLTCVGGNLLIGQHIPGEGIGGGGKTKGAYSFPDARAPARQARRRTRALQLLCLSHNEPTTRAGTRETAHKHSTTADGALRNFVRTTAHPTPGQGTCPRALRGTVESPAQL